MFSSIGPAMEQVCVNKSHGGSWCEFFKKRDQAIFETIFFKVFFFVVSQTNGISISFITLEKFHWLPLCELANVSPRQTQAT